MRNILKEDNLVNLEGRTKYSLDFINPNDIADKEILDIGCGFGWFEKEALGLNAKKIAGIEISEDNIAVSKSRVPDEHATFKTGTALSLPFPDKSFDTVVAWEVIEHIPKGKEKAMFQEIYRVLRDPGVLYLSTPYKTFWSNFFDPAWWLVGHRHYSSKQLADYAQNNSFKIEEEKVGGRWWSLLYILNMYIAKWFFRRRPFFQNFFREKDDAEYFQEGGFVNIFMKLKKL